MTTRFHRNTAAAMILLKAKCQIESPKDYQDALAVIQVGDCPIGKIQDGLCTIDGDCACLDVEEVLGLPTSKRFVMPVPPDFGEEQWR